MNASCPFRTGTSESAYSSSSVSLTLSRSMAVSDANGIEPSRMMREFGMPMPPANDVRGERR